MFCRHCGKQIPDHVKFCPYCGEAVSSGAPPERKSHPQGQPAAPYWQQPTPSYQQQTPPMPSYRQPNPPAGGNRNKFPLIIALIAVLLVAAAGGAFFLKSFLSGKSDSAASQSLTAESSAADSDRNSSGKDSSKADPSPADPASADKEEETSNPVNIIPANSALDDGNLFGNSHCYARAVSDGTYLYFRNALDKERTYWLEKGTHEIHPLTDIYMKDLHYKDGWLYYSRTTEGDVASGTRDNNIYRMNTSAEGNANLTFDNPQSWLSFETMAGGKCFFVYTDGKGITVDIGYALENGGGSAFLARVPAANVVDNPCINVVDHSVYYLAKDGLHCVDIDTKADQVVIPGFSCTEYIIYDGVIYFVADSRQGQAHASIGRINLDNTDRRVLFTASPNSGCSGESIQMSIYQGNIYFLLHLNYPEEKVYGTLHTMALDGSGQKKLMDDISWFNIIDHTLYYRYVDGQNSSGEASLSAPYYYVPFNEVINGNGNTARKELFDVTSFKAAADRLPDGVMAAFQASRPYLPASSQNLQENLELYGATYNYSADPEPVSSVVDHGSYYEITNCSLSVPYTLPPETAGQLKPGLEFSIEGSSNSQWQDGRYTVVPSDDPDYYTYGIVRNGENEISGYIDVTEGGTAYIYEVYNGILFRREIYEGSLYFSKDCQMYPPFDGGSPVSVTEYLTQEHLSDNTGFYYGYHNFGDIYICGEPVFDSSGLIIQYREHFYP